jgi:23S rRNA (cytidine1920-2'-O)/16S rRNA (cytidine1409-2'-O)-methyltransferase
MAGLVKVKGQKVNKPGAMAEEGADISVIETPRYVSRGGLKLEKALASFAIDVSGRVAMDVGAATGGFTDCLLQAGARKVYSVDVGYGQLDWRLRNDGRVVVMERTNIRYLDSRRVPEQVELAAVDVSFVSLALVFPVLARLLVPEAVTLVKPQFEVGKGRVGKKGVVREAALHLEVLNKTALAAQKAGFVVVNAGFSPVTGPEGNIEYLLHLKAGGAGTMETVTGLFRRVVEEAHAALG